MQVAARRLSWCSPVQGASWQHIAGRCQKGLRLGAEWGHCKALSGGLEAAPCTPAQGSAAGLRRAMRVLPMRLVSARHLCLSNAAAFLKLTSF